MDFHFWWEERTFDIASFVVLNCVEVTFRFGGIFCFIGNAVWSTIHLVIVKL